MRIFNRIVVSLLFAGLVALGVFAILYGFGLFGYSLTSLSQTLGGLVSGVEGLATAVTGGSPAVIAVLAAVALVGLILLIAELRSPRPRKVRLREKETYMTRRALRDRVSAMAGALPEVLEARAKAKTRRRTGGKVKLRAGVRTGEDLKRAKSRVEEQLSQGFESGGVPVSKLKLKLYETEARATGSRTGSRVS